MVAGLVAVTSVLAACGTGPPDHVRIGVIAPLTGPRAYLGGEVRNGVELAIQDLNRDGGLLGADVEVVSIDDADLVALPGQLADLAERSRVSAVIGPEAPGILLGPRSPLDRREVPAVLPTAFSGDLADSDSVVVRTVPSARVQAESLGRWLTEVRGIPDVAVLVIDPIEGTAAADDLREGLEAGGAKVAALLQADGAAAQLGPAVAALRADAPDAGAVLLWGPPPAAARATLAARSQDWGVQLAIPASSFVAEYRSLAGAASDGVVLAFPFRSEWFGNELTGWMLRYNREYGLGALPQLDTLVLDVPVVAVAAYDAVGLVADAVREAGTREPAAVGEALTRVEHEGILRDYRLEEGEAWAVDDLYVARFLGLGIVYDADPRQDADQQRRFWSAQVSADFLPQEALEGPAGALVEALIARGRGDAPDYVPPLPAPGPVGPRPGATP